MSLRPDANHCFVCGPGNPIGLQLSFHLDGEICRSEFTPQQNHCGYDGVTHGGIIFSALDDVMANWLFLKGIRAYTAKCDIRYKGPLPVGTTVNLEGICVKEKARLALLKGKMFRQDNGELVAETEASFMKAQ
ncbi:MAG TPA: thioesterase [Gammaproteobacteria bacterium]|nr:thioesterase [Gammaproteobacteria bacterium]|tara:strand:- start:596 stop:994 length:399 start_codon:yes stop_codon:yes gene_type:complete